MIPRLACTARSQVSCYQGILVTSRQMVRNSSVRGMFWWGHDTLEDQAARKAADNRKGLIAWTDPDKALEEKKEYTWSPARVEDEALASIGMFTGMTNHADVMKWMDRKLNKAWWHTWATDPVHFQEEMKRKSHNHLIASQLFLRDRLTTLGPDLAAAHFLCHRNCKVRFKGHTHWTELEPDGTLKIPALYVAGWYLEAIEASTADLVYEGFQNFRNLEHLKYLDLSYCNYLDEWCMDRITGEFHDTLEYLNISGCRGINWNGLECIWRLRNLKTLVIKDMDHVQDLTLICLMLLEVLPNLKIEGADYMDPTLLEGTEFEHLMLDDTGTHPRLEPGQLESIEEEKGKLHN